MAPVITYSVLRRNPWSAPTAKALVPGTAKSTTACSSLMSSSRSRTKFSPPSWPAAIARTRATMLAPSSPASTSTVTGGSRPCRKMDIARRATGVAMMRYNHKRLAKNSAANRFTATTSKIARRIHHQPRRTARPLAFRATAAPTIRAAAASAASAAATALNQKTPGQNCATICVTALSAIMRAVDRTQRRPWDEVTLPPIQPAISFG